MEVRKKNVVNFCFVAKIKEELGDLSTKIYKRSFVCLLTLD